MIPRRIFGNGLQLATTVLCILGMLVVDVPHPLINASTDTKSASLSQEAELAPVNAEGRMPAVSPSATPTTTPSSVDEKLPLEAVTLLVVPPGTVSQGPYIRLASGTFDPLAEPIPIFLPNNLSLDSYPGDGEGYYILQFKGPIVQAWKDSVTDAGARIFDYIPDFAFIVKMNAATKATIEAMEPVRWVGLYQPGYRIAPSLTNALASTEGAKLADVMVVVFKGEDMAAFTEQLQEMGGTILDVTETHWKGKVRVQIPRSQINAVVHLSGVKWIEPSPEWELLNNEAADILGVREVWDTHGLYGAGQIVAVCDSGLDQGSASPGSLHDDFEDGSGNSRVVAIYDRVGDGANDVNSGHGTHVAGSVLGNGDRSGSTPSSHTYPSSAYVGMAPEASLVFQAVEQNSTGYLTGIPSDLNTLFSQARSVGAHIHTNSWGSDAAGAYTSDSQDVDEFVWDHKDFTILFAAGNAGIDNNADGVVDLYSMVSPGTAKNCITVGASENERSSGGYNPGGACSTWGNCWLTDYPSNPIRDDRLSDDPAGMAAFSSRGPALDGRFKPDVVAPGTNIASVRSSVASGAGWGTINSYYMYMGGTSMATPLVAGTAALVRDFYTDIKGFSPSAALIKATLINGATDTSPGQYGTGSTQEIPDPPRPNNVEGWGRVNVENAIFPTASRELVYYEETSGLNTSEESVYNFEVTNSSEPLKVTLAWSDYPGSPAAAGGLVNDLDLTVTDPSSAVHYPNRASQRGVSQYLYYDDGDYSGGYSWTADIRVAVRFTPNSYPATLYKAQFMLRSSSYPKAFNYYIYDGDASGPSSVLASGSTTIRQAGWHVVDLSGHGVTINSGDFFLAIRLPDSDLVWFYDATAPIDGRSWDYDGNSWSQWPKTDYMFRAVVIGPDHSTSFDRVNNVVGVDIDNPALGTYTIRVQGHNVPQGPQPYALVASGAITNATNSPPVIAGLPDQTVPINGSADNAIDLWDYAGDAESADSELTFTIDNTPDPNAGVSIDSNRYIDINPTPGWTGQASVTIRVTDPGGLSSTDSFQVTVTPVAGFPFCDDFESGNLGNIWTAYTTNEGRVRVSSRYPYLGTYSVLLDDSTNNSTYSHAAIILTIDLSGQSDVELEFWWRDFSDKDDADDGVFLSDNLGTTWVTAMNFTGSQSSFRNEIVDVDAVAAINGLTLNDHFQIKFQFYDNYSILMDGYAIDEVCVQVPSFPDIEISPTSFGETVFQDEIVTRTLTISNTGTALLTFHISERTGEFTPTMVAPSTVDNTGHVPPEPAPVTVMPLASPPPGWDDPDVGPAVPVTPMDASGPGPLAWVGTAPMPTARARLAGATDQGCLLYAIGGMLVGSSSYLNNNEVYDPQSNSWATLTPMPTARSNMGAGAVNGVIYVPGGYNGSYLSTHEAYDIPNDSWSSKAPLPTASSGGVVAAANGKIYHIGGNTSSGYTAATYEYDPLTDFWTTKAPAPEVFTYAEGTVLNGYIYIAGGWLSSSSASTRFWLYDPVGNNWTVLASMNQGRQSPGLVAAGGYIYAFGGGVGWTALSSTEQYDPATNTWIPRPDSPLAVGRIGMATEWVRGKIWGIGGYSGSATEDVNEYLDEGYADNCGGDDVPWLSEEPTSDTVSTSGSRSVDVIFDAAGLALGDYTASLVVNSNDPDENPVTVPVTMYVVDMVADLALTKTDNPDPVIPGTLLTYTIAMTNTGPSAATGVIVTDTLPLTVTFASSSASQGTCSGMSTVTCTLGTISNGDSVTVTIVVTPTASGTFTNTASMTSGVTDPNMANNSATTSTTACYDFNGDGKIDIKDIMEVANRWRAKCGDPDPSRPSYDPLYDIDKDCDIDIVDIMKVVAHWGETCG